MISFKIQLMKERLHLSCPFEALKYYSVRIKEMRRDPISAQFAEMDNAVWMRHEPGEPLVVVGEDDNQKYFYVNAKQQSIV